MKEILRDNDTTTNKKPGNYTSNKASFTGLVSCCGRGVCCCIDSSFVLAEPGDIPKLISMLIFGLSMIELYTISAIYHIGKWSERRRRLLRAIDHANIFVLIAGTYTPLCFNILSDWLRITILNVIWTLALVGIASSIFTVKLPRWANAALYVAMGWVVILAIPA